jgi:hypothetical protein
MPITPQTGSFFHAESQLEEAVCGAACDDGRSPGEDAEISGGVECEGEQVEGDQDAGEGFLAVPKVMFEVVTVAPLAH